MSRHLKLTAACLSVLVCVTFAMRGLRAQGRSDVQATMSERGGGALRIEGDAAALRVEVRHATIAEVLSALAGFNIQYRSSIALDEAVEGTYRGSLGQVVSRVLYGYNYATKQNGSNLEVIIFGRRGEGAVPAPIIIPVRRRPSD